MYIKLIKEFKYFPIYLICFYLLHVYSVTQLLTWAYMLKQEGHRSPEKQFQSINTIKRCLYRNIKRKKFIISFLRNTSGSLCIKPYVPLMQRCIAPSLVEICHVVLMKTIFKFHQRIFAISS